MLKIVDCHLHFIDVTENEYPHFKQVDQSFVELVGDYSSLPRKYLPKDYLQDTRGVEVIKTVMAEFVSSDPLREAKWAQSLSNHLGHPHGIIALASPGDLHFEALLNEYQKLPNVKAVREHLLYDPTNPKKRFAKRAGILMDKQWRAQFAKLEKTGYSFEFEIFAHQIPELVDLAHAFPQIQMLLHPMGWPLDQSQAGFKSWKKNITLLSHCPNTAVKITAIGCIFRHWTLEQIRPWIREAIEIFGPKRAMFGSHLPLEKLDHSFNDLYEAYQAITEDLSLEDQESLFSQSAMRWYHL